ncbi:pentapeptide repeat-containing protein [Streptomyces sp. B21-101]|uniref:pentapeptide repeat-containing protein n=1 Tax=Streptomyces sp. B21-101 TaxID=3039415 RepID=UPI002FEE6677
MSQPNPSPSPSPPGWPHCGEDASAENSTGCPGIHVAGHTTCIAHLGGPERDAYLAGLAPGAHIDHRGTQFTKSLLDALLTPLRAPATGHPHLDRALFESATFKDNTRFESATFEGDSEFESATFERAVSVGPLVCAGRVVLSGAVFGVPVTVSVVARRLECRRTRWSSTAEVRLRYAMVDFAHAVFEYPLTIAAEPDPFVLADGRQLNEYLFASAPSPRGRLVSLRGVVAAHLSVVP